MIGNNNNNFFNSQKPKSFPLTLALVAIIFFFILNFTHTQPTIPILGFHGIIDSKNTTLQSYQGEMDYPKQDLEKLLEYFILHDYWFLTSQDLYDYFLKKSQHIPDDHRNKTPVMISFDDGYKTVYTILLPILSKLEKKYGIKVKVVLFINPGTLAKSNSRDVTHLGCRELREGLRRGFYDIQSHGLNHKDLTKLPRYQLVNEILQARIELRKCTQDLDPEQKVASHLAYPYGAYNKQVERYVSKYYLSSYLYNNEILNYGCLKNFYKIPRLMMNRKKTTNALIEVGKGWYPLNNNEKC
ncbi:polysaccharide deacetylase family protein [Nostoc sp. UHCC 0302]|uniref:polysaccharide deacetylase family protein n=1 Tax=Nostoc sp. UHCC 0302 TaxID=3134896 RepID=UPI00311CD5D4